MLVRRLAAPALVVVVLVFGAVLGACGGSDDASPAESDASATAPARVAMNDADIEFAQGMIPHHEQAIEMAEIALDPARGASADVAALATRIRDGQDPEVDLMTGLLTSAGASLTMDMSDGHDMASMPGMMSVDEMETLDTVSGPDFDQMWLTMMIAHHEGAITQAETVKNDGANVEVLALADQIISAQRAEITEMAALVG
jgi:uncharacterized protein (DUF305 family)